MNDLRDIIEMGGNLYEEAWKNGRREALKEVQGGKYEKLEETNRHLRAQIDNYEKIRLKKDEEIHQLESNLQEIKEQYQRIVEDKSRICSDNIHIGVKATEYYEGLEIAKGEIHQLKKKLENAEAKIKELNEALAIYLVPTPRDCPFCGGRPDVVAINHERWVVACHSDTCAVNPETDAFDTIEEAVSAWNHRVGGLTCGRRGRRCD